MAKSTITTAFAAWNTRKILAGQPSRPDQMVFALIPGQSENTEVNPSEAMPAAAQIKYSADITRYGALNENAVVYSVVLDTSVGNWDYNWIGLTDSATGTVLMIVHTPQQRKIKTSSGVQGNNLIRNLAMEYSGAAAASQINVTPETWMIDFRARLLSSDEQTRLANVDYYGPGAFQADSFKLSVSGTTGSVQPGLAYVGGLRISGAAVKTIPVTANTSVWVDATWQGTVTGEWKTSFKLVTSLELADYVDALGFQHYVTKIADIRSGVLFDTRVSFPLAQLIKEISQSYAPVGESYTKAESDQLYQPKGNYQPAGNYAAAGASYTKTESDQLYQVKGNYMAAGYAYSKVESDNQYQPKGSYMAAGYAYSKVESDYQYQPKGNYAAAGSSYSKAESDALFGNSVTSLRMANYGNTYGDLRDSQKTIMTGIFAGNGYDNVTNHEHRQLQFQIVGNWYNVAYV